MSRFHEIFVDFVRRYCYNEKNGDREEMDRRSSGEKRSPGIVAKVRRFGMKRVLLKLSGEALAGEKKTGFDEPTVMNCIYVSEIFRAAGMKTAVMTPFACGAFTELFSKDRVKECFASKTVTFFAGGTGHPYFSTDTATVLRAIEIEADVILLAKSIDGVYDSDPKDNPDAKKFDEISIQEVIDRKLGVVDMTASILCMEQKMPMLVFGLNEENSIVNTVSGAFHGTKVTVD